MAKITTKFCLLLISVLLLTCKTEETPFYDSNLGSILVTVKQNNVLIPNAFIIVSPEVTFLQTDESGAALLKDVEIGSYQINAGHQMYGTGIAVADVRPGEVVGVEIILSPGAVENPVVVFTQPEEDDILDLGVTNQLSVTVSDNNDTPDEIDLEWTSSVDGFLSNESAAANGIATIAVDNLSEGEHTLQVRAIDTDGFCGGASGREWQLFSTTLARRVRGQTRA